MQTQVIPFKSLSEQCLKLLIWALNKLTPFLFHCFGTMTEPDLIPSRSRETGRILGKDASRVDSQITFLKRNGAQSFTEQMDKFHVEARNELFLFSPLHAKAHGDRSISLVLTSPGHVGMSIESFPCTSTNRRSAQTHTVHSNFFGFQKLKQFRFSICTEVGILGAFILKAHQ